MIVKVKVKVPSLAIFGEQAGTHLRSISLWATQLCNHSECYNWDRPSGTTVCLTPILFPKMLNFKKGNSSQHLSSLW